MVNLVLTLNVVAECVIGMIIPLILYHAARIKVAIALLHINQRVITHTCTA